MVSSIDNRHAVHNLKRKLPQLIILTNEISNTILIYPLTGRSQFYSGKISLRLESVTIIKCSARNTLGVMHRRAPTKRAI